MTANTLPKHIYKYNILHKINDHTCTCSDVLISEILYYYHDMENHNNRYINNITHHYTVHIHISIYMCTHVHITLLDTHMHAYTQVFTCILTDASYNLCVSLFHQQPSTSQCELYKD